MDDGVEVFCVVVPIGTGGHVSRVVLELGLGLGLCMGWLGLGSGREGGKGCGKEGHIVGVRWDLGLSVEVETLGVDKAKEGSIWVWEEDCVEVEGVCEVWGDRVCGLRVAPEERGGVRV